MSKLRYWIHNHPWSSSKVVDYDLKNQLIQFIPKCFTPYRNFINIRVTAQMVFHSSHSRMVWTLTVPQVLQQHSGPGTLYGCLWLNIESEFPAIYQAKENMFLLHCPKTLSTGEKVRGEFKLFPLTLHVHI